MAAKPWWAPITHFLAHAVVGSVIFCIIATPAVGLSLLVRALDGTIPPFTLWVLVVLENVILIGDGVLLVVYLATTSIKFVKEMRE